MRWTSSSRAPQHVPDPVRRILEPAWGREGSAALAERGTTWRAMTEPRMVAFASARLARLGGRHARGHGDLPPARPARCRDHLVNSIGTCSRTTRPIPLECVAGSLEPGGVYLVQLSYGGEPAEQAAFGPWSNGRAGPRNPLTWRVARRIPPPGAPTRNAGSSPGAGTSSGCSRNRTCSTVLDASEDLSRIVAKSELVRFLEHPELVPRAGRDPAFLVGAPGGGILPGDAPVRVFRARRAR